MTKQRHWLNIAAATLALAFLAGCDSPANDTHGGPTSIKVTDGPDRRLFFPGDELDLRGLEVSAVYSDGTKTTVRGFVTSPADGDMLDELDDSLAITVTWKGMTTSFAIQVVEWPGTSYIELTKNPDKLVYRVGDELDLTGIEVTAVSLDMEYTRPINSDKLDVTYDFTTTGYKRITVRYDGTENQSDPVFIVRSGAVPPTFPKWRIIPSSNWNIWDLAFENGTFAVGAGNSNRVYYSSDGETWGSSRTQSGTSSYTNYGIAFGNNTWIVANGYGIQRSTDDMETWTVSPDTRYFMKVTFGNNTFVAVGGTRKIAYSTDNGETWTELTQEESAFGTSGINNIAFGNNTFVAVGAGGKIAYSTGNGETWTATADSTFGVTAINGIAFANGTFVAVGAGGKIAYSTDNGESWTATADSAFDASSISAVAFGNNTFVAVGASGKAAFSIDNGKTWTAIPITTFNDTEEIRAVAFGNVFGDNIWVIGGSTGIAYSAMP